MLKTLWTGRAGLTANQERMDMISNNLANMNTNGYKNLDVTFLDTFYEASDRLGVPITSKNKENLISGSGCKADTVIRDDSSGNITSTGNSSDMALAGKGYFRLTDGKGNYYYTRDGSFKVDKNGNFVHSSGKILDIQNYNPSSLKGEYKIDEKGNITCSNKVIGKINLYDFIDNDDLIPEGNNLLKANSNPTASTAKIEQGCVESSNVNFADEMVDMLMTQRAYQLNSKSIQAADEMWQITNNLRNK